MKYCFFAKRIYFVNILDVQLSEDDDEENYTKFIIPNTPEKKNIEIKKLIIK